MKKKNNQTKLYENYRLGKKVHCPFLLDRNSRKHDERMRKEVDSEKKNPNKFRQSAMYTRQVFIQLYKPFHFLIRVPL